MLGAASLALSRSSLSRAAERRDDEDWLSRAWADPASRVLVVEQDRVAIGGAIAEQPSGNASLRFVSPQEAMVHVGDHTSDRVLIGVDLDGRAYLALLADKEAQAGGNTQTASLREIGPLLSDRDAGIAAHAVGLANWHIAHPRCARCGHTTDAAAAGHVRVCPACYATHFPRTDPAVIMLVTDEDDRALLGHHPRWPAGRFSTLAGFVEPGESLEATVRREVAEETGVQVGECHYAGSQPWPFPASLMLAFYARATETTIAVDGDEIAEARWFSRTDLRGAAERGDVILPGDVSIARRLVQAWYGSEPLPASDWSSGRTATGGSSDTDAQTS